MKWNLFAELCRVFQTPLISKFWNQIQSSIEASHYNVYTFISHIQHNGTIYVISSVFEHYFVRFTVTSGNFVAFLNQYLNLIDNWTKDSTEQLAWFAFSNLVVVAIVNINWILDKVNTERTGSVGGQRIISIGDIYPLIIRISTAYAWYSTVDIYPKFEW